MRSKVPTLRAKAIRDWRPLKKYRCDSHAQSDAPTGRDAPRTACRGSAPEGAPTRCGPQLRSDGGPAVCGD